MSFVNGLFSLIIRAAVSYAAGWAVLFVFLGVFQVFMSGNMKKLLEEKGQEIIKLLSLFSTAICFIISFFIY